MRSIHLPRGRTQRIVLVAAVVVLAIGAGGAISIATSLADRRAPVASPATAVVSPLPAASPPDTSAPPSQPVGASPVPHRSSAPSQPSVAAAWALPPGWRYALACDDESTNCVLHLLDGAGAEQHGWPVAVPGECLGDVAIGPREEAFVPCTADREAVVTGLDRGGTALPGWPVRLRGSVAYSLWNDFAWGAGTSIGVGPDETVYVAVDRTGGRGSYAIHALAPDGSPRAGWPRALKGGAQGFTLAPDGMVVAWWYEGAQEDLELSADRTVFTTIRPDGHELSGWPIGSKGAASGPVVADDGSLFYTSATGKVWGHDRTGAVIDGWPYQLPHPIAPWFRSDRNLLFIGMSEVAVLDRDGNLVPGWPYRTSASFSAPSCDTPGFPSALSALAADGRLYLAEWDGRRTSIVALEPDGRAPAGWPYDVKEGWRVASLDVAGDGTVDVALTADPCGETTGGTAIHLDARGALIGDALPDPPTPLWMVYEALRLDPLRTSTGSTTYQQGDPIDLETALVNRTSTPMILPYVDTDDDAYYAAGTMQTWIERLGSESEMECLPNAGRKGAWYAAGGWIEVSTVPVTIQPDASLDPLFQSSLSPDLTRCLPPGDYRYHVEYKPLEGELDDVNDAVSIDITITAGEGTPSTPTPRPSPSPSPTPRPIPTLATPSPTPT